MQPFSACSKVRHPVSEIVLCLPGADLLRHYVLDMNVVSAKNIQFLVVSMLGNLNSLRAISRSIYEIR